ncbi:MAG: hypothetical protein NTY30_01110 [Candidatus Berkelbacteria bacterium]|nr:hypothetical protein [Candidatus Berkelbacteria bacterium]
MTYDEVQKLPQPAPGFRELNGKAVRESMLISTVAADVSAFSAATRGGGIEDGRS